MTIRGGSSPSIDLAPSDLPLPVMATSTQPAGQTVSHYGILRKVGAGGIGVLCDGHHLQLGGLR